MMIRAAAVRHALWSTVVVSTCRSMSTSTNKPAQVAAIAQLRSTNNKLRNLCNIAACAGIARQQGASMLFLPECFGFLGESSQETLEQAEPPIQNDTSVNKDDVQELLKKLVSSPSDAASTTTTRDSTEESLHVSLLDGLKVISKTSGLWISAGGMHESGAPPDDDRPRVYNSHVILDSNGNVKALYRKTHLFDVSIPNKVNLRESATTAPGTELVVCDSPIGKSMLAFFLWHVGLTTVNIFFTQNLRISLWL